MLIKSAGTEDAARWTPRTERPESSNVSFTTLNGQIGTSRLEIGGYPKGTTRIFLMEEAVCLADRSVGLGLSGVKAVGLTTFSEMEAVLDESDLRRIACVS